MTALIWLAVALAMYQPPAPDVRAQGRVEVQVLVVVDTGPVAPGRAVQAEAVIVAGTSRPQLFPAAYVRDLAPGETVRVLTVEQSRALHASGGPVMTLARIGWCEGGLDASKARIDTNGLPSIGAWQVQPEWWGPVPADLEGQARQAARIIETDGTRPWSARTCDEWNLGG